MGEWITRCIKTVDGAVCYLVLPLVAKQGNVIKVLESRKYGELVSTEWEGVNKQLPLARRDGCSNGRLPQGPVYYIVATSMALH